MSNSKSARLHSLLTQLVASSAGIDAAAVVSFDGLMMASALPEELDEDRVGAMSAALLSLGEQAVQGFGCGQLDQLFAEGDEGFVVMLSARDEAVLTAVADPTVKVGFILYEMRKAAELVADVLAEPSIMLDPPHNPLSRAHQMPLQSRPIFAPEETPAVPLNGHPAPPQTERLSPPAAWR
ncbi:MAG TPA: roadblock/LC7 domain-containing protein [Euzebya sp.]|nr:roadblock/LC7 domain-containing protein [Euzebya sp.]